MYNNSPSSLYYYMTYRDRFDDGKGGGRLGLRLGLAGRRHVAVVDVRLQVSLEYSSNRFILL